MSSPSEILDLLTPPAMKTQTRYFSPRILASALSLPDDSHTYGVLRCAERTPLFWLGQAQATYHESIYGNRHQNEVTETEGQAESLPMDGEYWRMLRPLTDQEFASMLAYTQLHFALSPFVNQPITATYLAQFFSNMCDYERNIAFVCESGFRAVNSSYADSVKGDYFITVEPSPMFYRDEDGTYKETQFKNYASDGSLHMTPMGLLAALRYQVRTWQEYDQIQDRFIRDLGGEEVYQALLTAQFIPDLAEMLFHCKLDQLPVVAQIPEYEPETFVAVSTATFDKIATILLEHAKSCPSPTWVELREIKDFDYLTSIYEVDEIEYVIKQMSNRRGDNWTFLSPYFCGTYSAKELHNAIIRYCTKNLATPHVRQYYRLRYDAQADNATKGRYSWRWAISEHFGQDWYVEAKGVPQLVGWMADQGISYRFPDESE